MLLPHRSQQVIYTTQVIRLKLPTVSGLQVQVVRPHLAFMILPQLLPQTAPSLSLHVVQGESPTRT
eukprot:5382705-Amphidinium_carterae.1